jgi:hypothetical protein
VIEIFLSAPIEIRVILLTGILIFLLEFIKHYCLKLVRKEDNNAKKGHNE